MCSGLEEGGLDSERNGMLCEVECCASIKKKRSARSGESEFASKMEVQVKC